MLDECACGACRAVRVLRWCWVLACTYVFELVDFAAAIWSFGDISPLRRLAGDADCRLLAETSDVSWGAGKVTQAHACFFRR